jgi:hypothetical protein
MARLGEGRIEDPPFETGKEGDGESSYQEQVVRWYRSGRARPYRPTRVKKVIAGRLFPHSLHVIIITTLRIHVYLFCKFSMGKGWGWDPIVAIVVK